MAKIQSRHRKAAEEWAANERDADYNPCLYTIDSVAQVLADQEAELADWLDEGSHRLRDAYMESRDDLTMMQWLAQAVRSGEWRKGDSGK